MVTPVQKKTLFIIGFWILFIILFIVSHKLLSNMILHYQQMPAVETKEAYQLISHYKQSVKEFYQSKGRCPRMADRQLIIPQTQTHTYVKVIRLLAAEESKTCFITAVMRDDTPSRDVKNQLLTIAYRADQQQDNEWPCYTSINNIYTIEACRNNPLPENFLKALATYNRSLQ